MNACNMLLQTQELTISSVVFLYTELSFLGSVLSLETLLWVFDLMHRLWFHFQVVKPICTQTAPETRVKFYMDPVKGPVWLDVHVKNGYISTLQCLIEVWPRASVVLSLPHSITQWVYITKEKSIFLHTSRKTEAIHNDLQYWTMEHYRLPVITRSTHLLSSLYMNLGVG